MHTQDNVNNNAVNVNCFSGLGWWERFENSSEFLFRSRWHPTDGNRQQAELAAPGNRQLEGKTWSWQLVILHGEMFIRFRGIFTTDFYLKLSKSSNKWRTKKRARPRISLVLNCT